MACSTIAIHDTVADGKAPLSWGKACGSGRWVLGRRVQGEWDADRQWISARIDIEDRPCVFCLVRGPCTIVISEIARRDQPCEEKAARPPDTLHGHTAFRDLHTKWLSGRGSMGESVRTPEGECENVQI